MKKITILISFVVLINLGYLCYAENSFEVDNTIVKLVAEQGNLISKNIEIINLANDNQDFTMSSNSEFFTVNKKSFELAPEEREDIEISFNTNQPGVYVGSLTILGRDEKKIPFILEVETKETLFDSVLSIPLEYGIIYPGDSLIVENKIFNLESLGIKNVDVEYNVQDFSGKSFFSEKENLVVENQILVTKSINLPGRMLPGDYALSVVVRYEESVGTSSYFFKITEKSIELKSSSFPLSFWFVIVAIVGIMFFFMAYIRQKDKLFLELENQRRRELKKEMRELAKEREKIHRMREGKRRRALSNLTKKRKKRAKAIQKIHKRRVKVLRQLKKQKRKSEMQKKLAEWKKEGYNIEEFLINEKNEKKSKEKRVKEYKKQGYKM